MTSVVLRVDSNAPRYFRHRALGIHRQTAFELAGASLVAVDDENDDYEDASPPESDDEADERFSLPAIPLSRTTTPGSVASPRENNSAFSNILKLPQAFTASRQATKGKRNLTASSKRRAAGNILPQSLLTSDNIAGGDSDNETFITAADEDAKLLLK